MCILAGGDIQLNSISPITDQANLRSWINLWINKPPTVLIWSVPARIFKHWGLGIFWNVLEIQRNPFKHRLADGFQDTVLGPVLNPGQRRVKSRNANLRKEMKIKCTKNKYQSMSSFEMDDLSGWSWGHPKDSCRVFTPGRTHACTVWARRAG